MDIHFALRIIRRWWWLVLAATVAGAGLAYGVSTRLTPTYQSTTTLLVVQTPTTGVVQLNDIQTAERLANTFSRLVTLRPVLERAIAQGALPFTPDDLLDRLTVSNPPATQLLEVSARSSQPELAALIANTVAQAFIDSNASAATSRPGQVSVVEEALPPRSPVAPRPLLNAALGAILLLLFSGALVALLEYLDDPVKSAEQASELTGLPALGRIEQFDRLRNPREQLQAAQRPRSTIAEAYRAARTNLTYAIDLGRERRLVLVTSPGPGEGKTTTAANLAVVFGLAGHRVCVVDTDLRRRTIHRVLGVENTEGLTNLLLARVPEFDRAVQRSVHTNVSVLGSGPLPPNPSELLGSARMLEILDWLREHFDIVLLDSPPALVVTDASVLATLVDGIVVVARAGKTRRGAIMATVEELAQTGRPIAGLILNRVRAREAGYYYASYGQRYEEDSTSPDATARLRVEDLNPPTKERARR